MKKNILIFGAGFAGRLVAEEIDHDPKTQYRVAGFIDDSKKINSQVGQYHVVGSQRQVTSLVKKYSIKEIIIAIPSAKGNVIRSFIKSCESIRVKFKIVPRLIEILQKSQVSLEQIRNIQPEDLLGREMVTVDLQKLAYLVNGKTILVSGAAGSIGSELCRQIAQFKPRLLIMIDWSENGMFALENELRQKFAQVKMAPIIGNIQDTDKVRYVFKKLKPDYVYHAAAFKHVSMMEANPEEAIKNNVFGTLALGRAAIDFSVKKFVFISTDKAVNPTNVMGASKRLAELVIDELNKEKKTKFMAVRFGNVLGSSGSVIPTFKQQIMDGGPVTVTHRNVYRYFMTIPEAVQLVLQSSRLGKGGELFVLDMGEPIKIMDLAIAMIKSVGLVPNRDIKIVITGLRPGEKLNEETLLKLENLHCIVQNKIYVTKFRNTERSIINLLPDFQRLTQSQDKPGIIRLLHSALPNFYHCRDNHAKTSISNYRSTKHSK